MSHPIWRDADEYEMWLGSQAEREADAYYEMYQHWCDDQEAKFYDALMREEYEAEMEAEASWADLMARVERGEYDDHDTLEDADLDDATRAYFSDEPIPSTAPLGFTPAGDLRIEVFEAPRATGAHGVADGDGRPEND